MNSEPHGNGSGAYPYFPSPLALTSDSADAAAGNSSHAGSFLQPNVLPAPDYLPPPSPAASTDLEDDAADDIVRQYLNLDGPCELKSGDDAMAEVSGSLVGSQQVTGQVSLASSSTVTENIQVPLLNSLAPEQLQPGTLELEQLPVPLSQVAVGSGSGTRSCMSMDRPGAEALFALARDKMVSEAQMEKIMRDEHLADLMLTDPKRVKKLLASRVYSTKRKQDNEKRILDLQHTIQMLEVERTTLSEELASLQSKSMEIRTENFELETKLQSMKKIAQLRGDQYEALTSEVEVTRAIDETIGSHVSNTSHQEMIPQLLNAHSGPKKLELPAEFH